MSNRDQLRQLTTHCQHIAYDCGNSGHKTADNFHCVRHKIYRIETVHCFPLHLSHRGVNCANNGSSRKSKLPRGELRHGGWFCFQIQMDRSCRLTTGRDATDLGRDVVKLRGSLRTNGCDGGQTDDDNQGEHHSIFDCCGAIF